MSDVFDPYYEWLGIPPKDQPPNHYRLLGIELFEENLNVIERAADRQMGHVRSFQTGRHAKESQRLLNELSSAKVCLLNAARKSEYDAQLQQKIASSSFPDLGWDADVVPELPPGIPEAIPVLIEPAKPVRPSLVPTPQAIPVGVVNREPRRPKSKSAWPMVAGVIGLVSVVVGGIVWMQLGKKNVERVPVKEDVASSGSVDTTKQEGNDSAGTTGSTNSIVKPVTETPVKETPAPTVVGINESEIPVEDPKIEGATPTVPAAIEETLNASAGMRTDRFAFCQTLLWNRFAEVHQALGEQGYRVSRCRPYQVQGDWRVAAIWLRDGLASRIVAFAESEKVLEADRKLKDQGFVPIDCFGATDSMKEWFGAVWIRPKSVVGECRLMLGVPANEYKIPKAEMLDQGFKSASHLAYFTAAGERKVCNLWIKPEVERSYFVWTGDQKFAEQQMAKEATIQADLMVTFNPVKNTVLYQGAQFPGTKDDFKSLIGISPDALRAAATEQSAAGNLPYSLSVTGTNSGEFVAAALWRPASQPQTPFGLANLPKETAEPTTTAVSEADRRALHFGGRGSVELAKSTGLSNIRDDFTVEMWLRFDDAAYGVSNILCGNGAYRGLHPEVTNVSMKGWLLGIKPAKPDANAKSQFILQWGEAGGQLHNNTGEILAFDTNWHHLAIVNQGSSGRWEMVIYVDGDEAFRASHTDSKDAPSPVGLYLGRPAYVAAARRPLHGSIRDFRLSSGLRYSASFQPAQSLKPDDTTLALLDFSATDATSIADVSGNDRHGKLSEVDWVALDGTPVRNATPLSEVVPAAPAKEKRPPPASSAEEVAKVRSIFKEELAAAKEPSALTALSKKLLGQAKDESESALQFALFEEARRLAADAADWQLAARVIEEQSLRFKVDPWKLRAEAFSAMAKKSRIATDRKVLADTAFTQAESALEELSFEAADSLLTSASNLAPRGDRDLIKQVSDLRKRLNDEKKSQQIVSDARAALEKNPDDATANEALGRYLSFTRDDWDLGIQHLAKGPTGKLSAVARSDELRPTDANDRMVLGEAWADYAKSASEAQAKNAAGSRALYWYQLALPDLSGVKKLQAEKQIEELSKSTAGRNKAKFPWLAGEPGVALELRGHTSDVTCMALARSGRFLVSGSRDDTIRVWDLATGKQVGQVNPGSRDVYSVLISPDDRSIAIPIGASGNGNIGPGIGIYSLQNGQLIGSAKGDMPSNRIAGSQDWRRVVYVKPVAAEGNLLVYNLTNLTPVAPLSCPGNPIDVAVSRTGRYLAVADSNNVIYVWDMQTGKTMIPLSGHTENITSLAFSPSERQLASASFRSVVVWDLVKGAEERKITPANNGIAGAVAYSPNGNNLLVAGLGNELTIFSARDGTQLSHLSTPDRNGSSNTQMMMVFPDGQAAATFSSSSPLIRIWRLPQ